MQITATMAPSTTMIGEITIRHRDRDTGGCENREVGRAREMDELAPRLHGLLGKADLLGHQ